MALSGAIDPYLRGDAYLIFGIDEEGESFLEVEEGCRDALDRLVERRLG